jgi:hypothetical protein
MNAEEKYYFDLHGFTHVVGALSGDEVARLNDAIERNKDRIVPGRVNPRLPPKLRNKANREDDHRGPAKQLLEGMLWWPSPDGDPFRELVIHPAVVARLNELCGPRFRLDSAPAMIGAEEGVDGDYLHAGGEPFDPSLWYSFRDGKFACAGFIALWTLFDVNPGDGGFAIVPGSHKSNLPVPKPFQKRDAIVQLTMKAGDLLLFTPTTTHGTLPWTSKQPRRSLLYKYCARTCARLGGRPFFPERVHGDWVAELSPVQRAVMYGPAAYGQPEDLDRRESSPYVHYTPILESDGKSVWIAEQE